MLSSNVSTLCVFCKSELESLNHVLLHCSMIWRIWANIVHWWNFSWVIPGSVEELLHWWSSANIKKKVKEIWKTIPLAVMWSMWKIRNECLFNEAQPNLTDLDELVKVRVAMWASYFLKELKYSS